MPPITKILFDVLSGVKDKNIAFSDLQKLLLSLGFQNRIKGSHFIYWKSGVEEIINIQSDGNKAKAYQVKQVRNIILKYGLRP
ncbi:MAG: type II toxin-antitoxin system HicA family toxin [Synergistaceae bacterium]|nr:type II toxin-antitoxin system HicA family toxin [Synergistaceae bacterium]MBQ7068469.1 type II toxin-antitoxin system HicA family toxin [Synergistaceae bacterium]MBR0075935.1 type II toxin-antitoxin system HicA family toxin [Synergistaceae bacterium]MBR0079452.1 type II toxin-antitoxin system HicA family toxin [Synergistaceae bacterium]MBR0233018.1 type II toxin-antitoxin system HicA family toxin [Synergistaceae bacterium]